MSPGDNCPLVFWIHWALKLQPVKYDPKLQMFDHFLVFDHLRQSRQLPPTASHALSPPPVSCSNRPTSATSDCRTLEYFWYSLKLGQANMCWCCHITYPVTIFATRFPSQSNTFRTSHDVTAAFPIVQCWLWRPPAFHCSYIQPGWGQLRSTASTFILFHCSYIQPGGDNYEVLQVLSYFSTVPTSSLGGEGDNYKPHVYFPTFLAQSLWHILTCLCNINSRLTAHFPLKCFEMGPTVLLHFQPLQIIEEKTFLPKTPNKTFGQFFVSFYAPLNWIQTFCM